MNTTRHIRKSIVPLAIVCFLAASSTGLVPVNALIVRNNHANRSSALPSLPLTSCGASQISLQFNNGASSNADSILVSNTINSSTGAAIILSPTSTPGHFTATGDLPLVHLSVTDSSCTYTIQSSHLTPGLTINFYLHDFDSTPVASITSDSDIVTGSGFRSIKYVFQNSATSACTQLSTLSISGHRQTIQQEGGNTFGQVQRSSATDHVLSPQNADLVFLANALAGNLTLTSYQLGNADTFHDGNIDSADLVSLANQQAGNISCLPVIP